MPQQPVRIAPSILSADFAALGREIEAVTAAGADWIHVDVMDGHFVPNLTIGPMVVKALRKHSKQPFDVHLMISPVDPLVPAFAEAGADVISFHPEAGAHLHRTIQLVKSLGKKAGAVLNPATPLAAIENVLADLDLVLVMSVNPGFSNQSFLPEAVGRVRQMRKMLDEVKSGAYLEVDGGVAPENIVQLKNAGANAFVSAHAIFSNPQGIAAGIATLREAADRAPDVRARAA